MLGVALVPTAGFSWLFVLPVQLQDRANNPYVVRMSAWRINSGGTLRTPEGGGMCANRCGLCRSGYRSENTELSGAVTFTTRIQRGASEIRVTGKTYILV